MYVRFLMDKGSSVFEYEEPLNNRHIYLNVEEVKTKTAPEVRHKLLRGLAWFILNKLPTGLNRQLQRVNHAEN